MEPIRNSGQIYLPTGDPQTSVETTQFRNELGQTYTNASGRWRKVQMASSVTQAIAAKIPLYWKDRANFIVSTDLTASEGEGNTVAGIIPTSVNGATIVPSATLPAVSQYFWMLERAAQCTVAGGVVNFAAVGGLITSAAVGVFTYTAPGTAGPRQICGTVHTAVDRSGGAGDVVIDLAIAPVVSSAGAA